MVINHEKYWAGQRIWDGVVTLPVVHNYKISLCTTCMNRLVDLAQTFPFNITHEPYPDVEFIVLDYNSEVPLDAWAKEYVDRGILTYYRTDEPKFYSMGHSRNVVFSLATGDIVINIDADNFLVPRDKELPLSFCQYVNVLANQSEGHKAIFAKGKRLIHGRLGCFRDEFMSLRGYDEEMTGYGYDDTDLLRRLWANGCTLYWFGGAYIDRIHTPRYQKGQYMSNKNWKRTEKANKALGWAKMDAGLLVRNTDKLWGKCRVTKNFREEIQVENI